MFAIRTSAKAGVQKQRRPWTRAFAGLLGLLAMAVEVGAQPVVSSPRAEALSVTVYRDPDRNSGGIDLDMLGGFALITETRTLTLPAGRATIRFEGVAGGIVPVSAIVRGLPGAVIEKNRDRALLSPAALLDGSLGRHVVLRRTDPATGKVRDENAVIRSGSAGAVVLETRGGIEALRCSGLPETLVYDAVPEGLSAVPTLSVETESPAAGAVTVQLSYLAGDFDWAAYYIVQLSEDGGHFDLFAWLTLANANGENFPDARTQAVAGRLNREGEHEDAPAPASALRINCWPMDITSTHDRAAMAVPPPPPAPMAMMAPAMAMRGEMMDIMVTAQRRTAQEELGDLKLYRISEPVTVAANAQKQVALIEKSGISFERVLRFRRYAGDGGGEPVPAGIVLRTRNKPDRNLGVPMPSGGVAIFERGLLVGQAQLRDIAVGEEVEIEAGQSAQVLLTQTDDDKDGHEVSVSNANPWPVAVEVEFDVGDGARLDKASVRLGSRNGRPLWKVDVPANDSATLRYRLRKGS